MTLMEQGRKCYKSDQEKWMCSSNHVSMGTSEVGKKAPPCKGCGETLDERIHAYLVHKFWQFSLAIEDSTSSRFFKSEQHVSIPYDQFLKLLFELYGVPGCGVRSPAVVSAKSRCSNQCTRPTRDLKDAYTWILSSPPT